MLEIRYQAKGWFTSVPREWMSLVMATMLVSGCEWVQEPDDAQVSPHIACGQQCLQTGDQCHKFFGTGQQSGHFEYESAWASHWVCQKSSGDEHKSAEVICLPPTTNTPPVDYCAKEVDDCLLACSVTREEIKAQLTKPVAPPEE
jgi:hypothetical protein